MVIYLEKWGNVAHCLNETHQGLWSTEIEHKTPSCLWFLHIPELPRPAETLLQSSAEHQISLSCAPTDTPPVCHWMGVWPHPLAWPKRWQGKDLGAEPWVQAGNFCIGHGDFLKSSVTENAFLWLKAFGVTWFFLYEQWRLCCKLEWVGSGHQKPAPPEADLPGPLSCRTQEISISCWTAHGEEGILSANPDSHSQWSCWPGKLSLAPRPKVTGILFLLLFSH